MSRPRHGRGLSLIVRIYDADAERLADISLKDAKSLLSRKLAHQIRDSRGPAIMLNEQQRVDPSQSPCSAAGITASEIVQAAVHGSKRAHNKIEAWREPSQDVRAIVAIR